MSGFSLKGCPGLLMDEPDSARLKRMSVALIFLMLSLSLYAGCAESTSETSDGLSPTPVKQGATETVTPEATATPVPTPTYAASPAVHTVTPIPTPTVPTVTPAPRPASSRLPSGMIPFPTRTATSVSVPATDSTSLPICTDAIPVFADLDEILSDYTGETKAIMDGKLSGYTRNCVEPTPTAVPTPAVEFQGVRAPKHIAALSSVGTLTPDEVFVSVSIGGEHTCALREDGAVVCWGDDGHGQATPPKGEHFSAISSGANHACGLREDSGVVCWGDDGHGQATPPKSERFKAISSGINHTCALRYDGAVVCWGDDGFGKATPPDGERFRAISGGSINTCGLREDGVAVCWGDDGFGQSTPPEGERFTSISATRDYTCGLAEDGSVVCWGNISDDFSIDGDNYTELSSYEIYTCGLTEERNVLCWNGQGIFDDGSTSNLAGENLWSLSVGPSRQCGLRVDGVIVCDGGRREDGRVRPAEDARFVTITGGLEHVCGLQKNGFAVCWGQNSFGQLIPPQGVGFIDISSGAHHTCGLQEDGTAVCWGG